ncbi:MAG: sigma-70 family RNA polymerase sigma factor [Chloroflexi bacterium]|nr:sigma-70 family RNA polymerase sigma factor [Chloroflexota bacterium]
MTLSVRVLQTFSRNRSVLTSKTAGEWPDTAVSEDETTLIRQAQAGNPTAFEALVNQYAPLVYNLALRTLNNRQEAEDIAQETFVRAWKGLPTFRAESRLGTWLYRITTNLCYNRLPRLKSELAALDADEVIDLQDERPSVEGILAAEELVVQVYTAVDNLPESYRLLISLRHRQGMSYKEIAQVTQMPLGSVKTGIFRARKLLREMLTMVEEAPNG